MFRKPVNDAWRQLTLEQLKKALIAVGVSADCAAEYCDDRNALPRELRLKVNAYLRNTPE